MFSSQRSLVEQYFQDIEDARGLPSEKEKELSQRIQEGDEDALKELVQANLLFVITIAKDQRPVKHHKKSHNFAEKIRGIFAQPLEKVE